MKKNPILENANKLAYLRKIYPELESSDIMKLLQVSGMDQNAAVWLAEELGFITVDKVTSEMAFSIEPDTWQFGTAVETLEESITYCFQQLAKREVDLDERFLTDWLIGVPPQDSLVATQHLVEKRVLFEYELTDETPKTGKSAYKFYTLYENSEMQWGKKNFKKEPKSEGEK